MYDLQLLNNVIRKIHQFKYCDQFLPKDCQNMKWNSVKMIKPLNLEIWQKIS